MAGNSQRTGRRVLCLNWRDTRHPEGGGSERYIEQLAEGLAELGDEVTIFCAAHPRAPADEIVNGVRFWRRGGRLTIYLHALWYVLRHRADVVIDVQNGMPFFSVLVARCPVIVLVHHVHREQWRVVLPALLARFGWWIESWLAPRLYRDCQYVTVSEVTRGELVGLGVLAERITVVPNGTYPVPPAIAGHRFVPGDASDSGMASPDPWEPALVTVGRLVPHKRVEHAIDTLYRLSQRWPTLRLHVVGEGWWSENLMTHARERGVEDRVTMHGYVDEHTKHEILSRAWLHLCPSLKEGWGIVVMEAAMHGVPTVAYRNAGGLAESVVDGATGLLADTAEQFTEAVSRLLADHRERCAMGEAARQRALTFTWANSIKAFDSLLPGGDPLPRQSSVGR
ncbi:MAG TPA: glycosyltransferase family 4 protein [Micromonosporaceae bacterium]